MNKEIRIQIMMIDRQILALERYISLPNQDADNVSLWKQKLENLEKRKEELKSILRLGN